MYGLNTFLMLALVSRVGSVEEVGAFGIAFTTAQLMYIVGLFGVSHYQMTDYDKTYSFREYGLLRSFSCTLMAVGCAFSIWAMDFSGQKALLTILLTLLMVLNVVGDLYQNLFFQNNRLDLSGSALFYRTFWPLLVFAGTYIVTKNLVFSICLQIFSNFVVTMYYVVRVAPAFLQSEHRKGITVGRCRKLLLECLPLFVSLMLMNLVLNTSKYGIEFWMDDQAQGYFNMIFMPAQVINLCGQFLFKPMLNQYATLIHGKQQVQFRKLLGKQAAMMIGFTLVCCTGASFLGAPVLGLLYQKDLFGYVAPLVIVLMGGGALALTELFYFIYVILRWQKRISGIYLVAIMVAVPITYWLIQWLGVSGAALSFAAVHCVILLLYAGILWKEEMRRAV